MGFKRFLLAALLVSACRGEGPDMVGYFKSESNDRVIAYVATAGMTNDIARAILDNAPVTDGRVTTALIYPASASLPGGDLTNSPSLTTALRLVGEAPYNVWRWRLRINPAGERTYEGF